MSSVKQRKVARRKNRIGEINREKENNIQEIKKYIINKASSQVHSFSPMNVAFRTFKKIKREIFFFNSKPLN